MYMMGADKLNKQNKFIVELQEVIAELKKENEKLMVENGLFRQSSEEQRELNSKLRLELRELENANPNWEQDE